MLTPDDLRPHDIFKDLPDETLHWFIDHAEELHFEKGDHLFTEGGQATNLFVMLDGQMQLTLRVGEQLVPISTFDPGAVAGVLPYSRLETYAGSAAAIVPSVVLALPKACFTELEQTSQELTQRFVAVMTNRVRESSKLQQQREKMMALGKLSAGLAHELNNPAAAIRRTSSELRKRVAALPEQVENLGKHQLSGEQMRAICVLVKESFGTEGRKLSPLEKSDREDEVADWLEDHGLDDGYAYAEQIVLSGIGIDELESIRDQMPEAAIGDVVRWFDLALATERLVDEIQSASGRISELVGSIKNYTHMDRSDANEATDVSEGLGNTLVMLNHKLKGKQVRVVTDFPEDLPKVEARPGELNQVWTNLIDNALDAMDAGGTLRIEVRPEGEFLKVLVIDDGRGIPTEVQSRIFEPFFTTKGVGEGTGLGLDVVQRIVKSHRGDVKVRSEPGHTEFEVCLPQRALVRRERAAAASKSSR
ncbi:MAG: ATP-binding protein [Catalinimonas sp.]